MTYHIQTEDKGLASHLIVSLVYDRGTILASKRTSYEDLAADGVDETALAERVSKQHKLICAAVRAGRISDLQTMTRKAKAAVSDPAAQPAIAEVSSSEPQPQPVFVPPPSPVERVEPAAAETLPPPIIYTAPVAARESSRFVTVPPIESAPVTVPDVDISDLPIFDAVTIVDDVEVLPDEAVAVVSELSGSDRPAHEKLSIDLLGDTRFKGGDRVDLSIMICRGTSRKVVKNAQIMVKVLGSSFRPVIFHARSDANGLAKIHVQMPRFQAGRAAMLVRAIADGQEVELRRVISPG